MTNRYIKLWDHTSDIEWHWPGKAKLTVKDINTNPDLSILKDNDIILFTDDDGKVFDWTLLDYWKSQYNVDETNPQTALEACLEARDIPEVTIADLGQMLDSVAESTVDNELSIDTLVEQTEANAAAIEELIPLVLGE